MAPIAFKDWLVVGAVCLSLLTGAAQAAIVLQGTRVVFSADVDEVTLKLKNTTNAPVLVQSWVDDGRAELAPEDIQVPFVVAPTVARVDPVSAAVLRIRRIQPLPVMDRESLFWLNVMETPPRRTSDQAVLQFAFRTRIKLFYRPTSLSSGVDKAADQLNWQWARRVGAQAASLEVTNPTPFYVSFGTVSVHSSGHPIAVATGMVAPFGKTRLALPTHMSNPSSGATVHFEVINDYGGRRMLVQPLTL